MDVSVCIGTFGGQEWADLARERAIPSAEQFGGPVIHEHAATLHDARNRALAKVKTPWVVFLDADDELDALYLDAMSSGTADIRASAVQYIRKGRPLRQQMPKVWGHHHDCTADCLPEGNWIVIGAFARTQLLRDVGGFRDFAWSEDWDLWLRCYLAGATFEAIPAAVYRAYVRADSRNRAPDQDFKLAVHRAIYAANFPDSIAA